MASKHKSKEYSYKKGNYTLLDEVESGVSDAIGVECGWNDVVRYTSPFQEAVDAGFSPAPEIIFNCISGIPVELPNGNDTYPALRWKNELNSGRYRYAANEFIEQVDGTQVEWWNKTQRIFGTTTTMYDSTHDIEFRNDNTGTYEIGMVNQSVGLGASLIFDFQLVGATAYFKLTKTQADFSVGNVPLKIFAGTEDVILGTGDLLAIDGATGNGEFMYNILWNSGLGVTRTATLDHANTGERTYTFQDADGTLYQSGGTDIPITDGGTGASTNTAGFDNLAPTSVKGDIIVYNGSDNIRLGVGANTEVLTADDTTATGLKWAAAGGGGAPAAAKYLTIAAHADLSAEVVEKEPFQGRMQRDDATHISLQRFCGDLIVVNGEAVDPGSGGITCITTDNLIAADGTDSGGAMAASTVYYVYVSNASASFAATDLRASATAPSLYNGVLYLAASGNGAHWRYVGLVRTNALTNFVDSLTQRYVSNYYNRRPLAMYDCPSYTDNNASSSYGVSSATWAEVNGGTNCTLFYLTHGDNPIIVSIVTYGTSSSGLLSAGIGWDSATDATERAIVGRPTVFYTNTLTGIKTPALGYHYVKLLAADSSTSGTLYSDLARIGSAADCAATYIMAEVMG